MSGVAREEFAGRGHEKVGVLASTVSACHPNSVSQSVISRSRPALTPPPAPKRAPSRTRLMFRVLTPASPPPFIVYRFGCELLLLYCRHCGSYISKLGHVHCTPADVLYTQLSLLSLSSLIPEFLLYGESETRWMPVIPYSQPSPQGKPCTAPSHPRCPAATTRLVGATTANRSRDGSSLQE